MCGIAGIVRFDDQPIEEAELASMTKMLAHRGPDGQGSWTDGRVGFGHTRLSIIDLAGSPQPMEGAGGRLQVCFNGEIFNYERLRAGLDYPFRTQGDTEVLLALFDKFGPSGVEQLVGQFAYAIHDAANGDVYLFRDRLGVLPLYYVADGHRLAFASEIKALLPVLGSAARVDHGQLGSYLMRRAVPAPATLIEGVRKVPPGHYLRVRRDGSTSLTRYWDLPDPHDLLKIDDAAAIDLIDGMLGDAVTAALVADVPIGSYLSGGVDSSLIVALAAKQMPAGTLNTFSAAFGDPRYDETEYADIVARKFDCRHHVVDVRASDFVDLWSKLTWHRDAPLSEPADIAVFRLAETARQSVKVVLSGEGSDELFGGYPKYKFARATAFGGGSAARSWLLQHGERALPARSGRARVALRALSAGSPEERAATWFAPFTRPEAQALLGIPQSSLTGPIAHRDGIDLMGRLDLTAWLPDNLLERGDRMSMAASLELRPPFMNHHLVETAFRLPSGLKVRDGQTKWIVKQVAARYLPDEIVNRRKVGFRVPLDSWFREGLRELCGDLLLGPDSFVGEVFDRRIVQKLVDSHNAGRRNEEIRLWTLLSLEVWAREYVRQPSVR